MYSPDCFRTPHVGQAALTLQWLLLLPAECLDYRCVPPYQTLSQFLSICLIFNLKMLLRQGLSMKLWLICNSLCRSGWPKTHRTLPACLPNAEIIGVGHQTWPFSRFFSDRVLQFYPDQSWTHICTVTVCTCVYARVCVCVCERGGRENVCSSECIDERLTLGVFLYCSPHYV